jgi:hypothetical protein
MRDLRCFFRDVDRDQVPARLGITMSSLREAERQGAPASWYWPLVLIAAERRVPSPDPMWFHFRPLRDGH